jgi:hypothetical protein
MILPSWLLALPPQAKAARIELTARLKAWVAGDWERLAEQARATAQETAARYGSGGSGRVGAGADTGRSDGTLRYVERLVECGQLSKAARVLAQPDAVITEVTAKVVEALKRKNPPADHPTVMLPLPPEASDCAADAEDIARAIMRMNRHAAPDMFGWRAEHLQELPPDVRTLIARAFATIAADPQLVPPSLRPFLAGARQVPLRKQDGSGIRPIAVGCLFRRVVAKAMAAVCRPAMAQALEPLQLGLSAGAGTEQALHRLRMMHAASGAGTVFAELDATNAFNTVDRATVIREADRVVPGIAAWIRFCYDQPSLLVVRSTEGLVWYQSERGVQQGDPLGPALFALAHHTALQEAVQERRGIVTAIAYLDDVGVVGLPADVAQFARTLEAKYARIGLRVNWEKSYATPGISGVLREEARPRFLGAPFLIDGQPPRRLDDDDMADVKRLIRDLPSLPSPRAALLLLRHVVGSTGMYALRTSPPRQTSVLARAMEVQAARALAVILRRGDLPPEAVRALSSLPPPVGLGLPSPTIAAPFAYAASLLEALAPLAVRERLPLALPYLSETAFGRDLREATELAGTSIEELIRKGVGRGLQRALVAREREKVKEGVLARLGERVRERVRARGDAVEAGAWLAAPAGGEFAMTPEREAVALSLWLGLAPPGAEGRRCACGAEVDADGHHLLVCPRGAGPTRRHATVQRVLAEAFLAAGCAVRTESELAPAEQGRPPLLADLVVCHPGLGRLIIDVQIIDALTPARRQAMAARASDDESGGATGATVDSLEKAARRKIGKYRSVAAELGMVFRPFILDVSGAPHSDARDLLGWLGANAHVPPERLSWQTPTPRAYWWQRLGVALQDANAAMALACLQDARI